MGRPLPRGSRSLRERAKFAPLGRRPLARFPGIPGLPLELRGERKVGTKDAKG